MNTCDCACHTAPKSHAIYGNGTYQNGIKFEWLRFIDGKLTLAAAKIEAVRIVVAQGAGSVKHCLATDRLPPTA